MRLRLSSVSITAVFHAKGGFATVLDSDMAPDLVDHGWTCLVKKGAQQVDGGKQKHLSEQ